nr:hypothetical protein [Micromonospora sp. DSM 115978]
MRLLLDGDDAGAAGSQSGGEDAGSGAEVQDEVAWPDSSGPGFVCSDSGACDSDGSGSDGSGSDGSDEAVNRAR